MINIKNKYNLNGEFGVGYASNTNKEFYFDLDDFYKIKDYRWAERPDGYLISMTTGENIRMHRLIMNVKRDFVVDHINHNTLDNRKENLRICNQHENSKNCIKHKNNTSGTSGVSLIKTSNRWRAYIYLNGKQINLGVYKNINDATKARKDAEIKYFGEYRCKLL